MRVLVVGAAGDVGRGVVAACEERGWSIVAAGRREEALLDVAQEHPDATLDTVLGSLDTEQDTTHLANAVGLDSLGAVVVATSGTWSPTPVADCSWETITGLFEDNLRPHVNAARVLIPRLPSGSTYLAVGGGMADAIFPGMAPVSMAQAAQRNLLRAWHKEHKESPVTVKELIIASMVNGRRKRGEARQEWLTDIEIGDRVAAILASPTDHPGAVLTISPQDRERSSA